MLREKNYSTSSEAEQAIVEGCLRLDKIPVAAVGSNGAWKRQKHLIFYVIKAIAGRIFSTHEGKCTTDRRFKRHRAYITDSAMIEIFHGKRRINVNGEKRFGPYVAVFRITTRDFSAEHVQIALNIEELLDALGFPHNLGTRRDHCEIAFDMDYESWGYVQQRSLWRWTKPEDHSFFDAVEEKVLSGFDPMREMGAQSHYVRRPNAKKSIVRRYIHSYIDSRIDKYRFELRLNRDFLREHRIETVSELVRKSETLMRRYLSLWEPDIAKILRFRKKCESTRTHAAIYRRTPGYYEKLVSDCSTAEVLAKLQTMLPGLKPCDIKKKCFKKADVEIVMKQHPLRPFKSTPIMTEIIKRAMEEEAIKYGHLGTPLMHERNTLEKSCNRNLTPLLFPEMVLKVGIENGLSVPKVLSQFGNGHDNTRNAPSQNLCSLKATKDKSIQRRSTVTPCKLPSPKPSG